MLQDEIIQYLRTQDTYEQSIWEEIEEVNKKRREVSERYESVRDDLIYASQASSSPTDAIKVQSSNESSLLDSGRRATEMIQEYQESLDLTLYNLYAQLEFAKRMFLVIRVLSPFARKVIEMYYKNNGTNQALEIEFQKDHKTMIEERKKIINTIEKIYTSDIPNKKLSQMKNTDILEATSRKCKKNPLGQLSFGDLKNAH